MKNLIYLLPFLLFFACGGPDSSTKNTTDEVRLFEKVSHRQSGLDFRNDLESNLDTRDNYLFFEYYHHGGGVAVGDLNNDGLPDVFFTGNTSPNKLYVNKGNLKFEDITESAGINTNKVWSTGVSMADVNNDGWLDIYVCQGGPNFEQKGLRRNLLYINNGDLTFTEKAEEFGLADANLSTQAGFFDYDKDGDLDCFVMNESEYFQTPYEWVQQNIFPFKDKMRANSCRFLRNDNGKFKDITEEAGLLQYSFGLGLVPVDVNQDGWTDIYVANDYSVSDFLFINQKDGTFKESIKDYTDHVSWFAMGADIADINNDGLPDIATLDMASPDHFRSKVYMAPMNTEFFWYNIETLGRHHAYMFNSLQLNNGNGTFSNIADYAGVSKTEWSWAALLADFDNDGFKDYFVSNGFRRTTWHNDVRKRLSALKASIKGSPIGHPEVKKLFEELPELKMPNLVYRNRGDLRFEDMSEAWGVAIPSFSNGAAYADLDQDGDLDLLVNNIDDYAFLLENKAEQLNHHYLRFRFPQGPSGLGGKVKVYMPEGKIQIQEYQPTRGYASSVEHHLHFGLDSLTEVEKVEVLWPDGKWQLMQDVAADQLIELDPAAATDRPEPETQSTALMEPLSPAELGLTYRHRENEFNDFSKQVLLPYRHSTLGPCLARGDFNGDGREDLFTGGAAGQAGSLWLQQADGRFSPGYSFAEDQAQEDIDAASLDADGDGDLDLYVLSGGYEFEPRAPELVDRLYLNDGRGNFSKAGTDQLPAIALCGRSVAPADVDGDGDTDLFIGGGVMPGRYPYAEQSVYLRNESGAFVLDTTMLPTPNLGLVNAAQWADLNADGAPDLVLAGEWEKVRIFLQENGKLIDRTATLIPEAEEGWWYSLRIADVDDDGDLDILAGNVGENTKFQTDKSPKLYVYADDFDHNNTCDVVLTKTYKGKKVPVRGLQCSSEQMPFIKNKYRSYVDFAEADLPEILGKESMERSLYKKVETFTSGIYLNEGGTFRFQRLPARAQLSPLLAFHTQDVNGDGRTDILLAGNIYQTEVETPRWDAGQGLLLLQGEGGWEPQTIARSGFCAPHDAKDMVALETASGTLLVVANNNGALQTFRIKEGGGEMLGMRD